MPELWTDPSSHVSRFVEVNGVRINYLDWGGSGPPLILIHGFGDNPHAFDDLAPELAGRSRVFGYARRAHGLSENKPPYDTATLVGDLRGLMDSLEIQTANLAGCSMGGNEITALASLEPERVNRLVYLDAAYDWSDPAWGAAVKTFPIDPSPTAADLASLDAFRAHWARYAPGVRDPDQIEAFLREYVIELPDGTVKPRMDSSASSELWSGLMRDRKDYTRVRARSLAIYTESFLDSSNFASEDAARTRDWEEGYMLPYRRASVARIRRELKGVEVLTVPGCHNDFLYVSREVVASAMNRFLGGGSLSESVSLC